MCFFGFFVPTRQVRTVGFYVSCLLLLSFLPFRAVSPQPRADVSIVLCRTCTAKTATICVQCSLPDLHRDHPRPVFTRTATATLMRPVFPAGPQLRPAVPSVPCRTSTATICAQCSLPGLHREIECQKECQKICQKECQKICQKECQTKC